jgi:chromosome segregation ATPase
MASPTHPEDNFRTILHDHPGIKEKLGSLFQTSIEVLQGQQSEILKEKDDKIKALEQKHAAMDGSKDKEITRLSTSLKISQMSERHLREVARHNTELIESENRKRKFLESEVTKLKENVKELTDTKKNLSSQSVSLSAELAAANNDNQRYRATNIRLSENYSWISNEYVDLHARESLVKRKLKDEIANLKRNQDEMTSGFAASTGKSGSEVAGKQAKRTRLE